MVNTFVSQITTAAAAPRARHRIHLKHDEAEACRPHVEDSSNSKEECFLNPVMTTMTNHHSPNV